MPLISAADAIREAQAQLLASSKEYILMGEGVPDPKAMFGTTRSLKNEFPDQVFDIPIAENMATGLCVGAAVSGLRPILAHMRIDFTLYAADQFINNAAKWWPMFGMQQSVPMVVRAIVGRGWGQGIQHSQQLDSLYASVPGIKVVSASNAYNAKGLLIAAAKDPNPVLFIEHRWVHYMLSEVPTSMYEVEIGHARVAKEGHDLTIVTWGYMVAESLKAAEFLDSQKISTEVIDLQTLRPIDFETVKQSVRKTGKLLIVHDGWGLCDIGAELQFECLAELSHFSNVSRLSSSRHYCPATPYLSKGFYPSVVDILLGARFVTRMKIEIEEAQAYLASKPHDVPNEDFKGPF